MLVVRGDLLFSVGFANKAHSKRMFKYYLCCKYYCRMCCKLSLSKKSVARIIVQNPKTRKTEWQGTVYENSIKNATQVVKKIKEALS